MGQVIQEQLQVIAEGLLPDSQCGFQRGRGCINMIFIVRQLMEKTREHDDYSLFVDLKRAYDSVPREGSGKVWCTSYNAECYSFFS